MSNDITNPANTEMANFADEMLTGLGEQRATLLSTVSTKAILKLGKLDGEWTFGIGDDPVQPGSRWLIDVRTMGWGWVCWTPYGSGENKRLGLVTNSIARPLPPQPAPIQGNAFTLYITFEARCIDGEDEGTEIVYGVNTKGGLTAFDKLRNALFQRLQRGGHNNFICPLITMSSDIVNLKSYGPTAFPVFTIVGWGDVDGNIADGSARPAIAPKPEPEPVKPVRQRKPPINDAAPEKVAANDEPAFRSPDPGPVPTQRVHTGQRRRPSASA